MVRVRSDSKENVVKIMQAANICINPPATTPLLEDELPFFENVIAEFARAQWSNHALEIAAMMARTMSNLNKEQLILSEEGFVITRDNGTVVENPRSRVVKSLTGDLLSLRRSLGVNARAREEAHVANKKTQIAKSAESNGILDDDLIARPL